MSDFYYKDIILHVKSEEEKMVKLCVRNYHTMLPSQLEIALKGFDFFCRKTN